MNLILVEILMSPSIKKLQGALFIENLLQFGSIILIIFSTIFLIYAYNFFLKKRSKDFGLYHILGMNKTKILKVVGLELTYVYLITVILGSLVGLVLSKLFFIILSHLIGESNFNLSISFSAIGLISLIILVIYSVLFIISSVSIAKNSGLSLLKANVRAEKEPKNHFILALLGVILIGYGYYLSLSIVAPLAAIFNFFQAVVSVILGTYLFYMATTIAVLKLQKKNKKYYYQSSHMINVSTMLYRMKQNAIGLANITILITMVLVTISTTVALHAGFTNTIKESFPNNSQMSISLLSKNIKEADYFIDTAIHDSNSDSKIASKYYISNPLFGSFDGDKFINQSYKNAASGKNFNLYVLTAEDYNKFSKKKVSLANSDVLLFNKSKQKLNINKTIDIENNKFNVKHINSLPVISTQDSDPLALFMIVANHKLQNEVIDSITKKYPEYANSYRYKSMYFMNSYSKKLENTLKKQAAQKDAFSAFFTHSMSKTEYKQSVNSFTGGFLFIGAILGFTFVLGATLIIYYKQLSEAENDKASFISLQEIGFNEKDVKKVINQQIVWVFGLPLIIATIHFIVVIPMLHKMLSLLTIDSMQPIIYASISTFLIIVVVYFLIYHFTSKSYFKIVKR